MEELFQKKPKKSLSDAFSWSVLGVVFYAGVIISGFYVILFSKSSLETTIMLESKIQELHKQINQLNHTNAQLQKDYFELLSIQGDYDN